jgi:hypothetical protein
MRLPRHADLTTGERRAGPLRRRHRSCTLAT